MKDIMRNTDISQKEDVMKVRNTRDLPETLYRLTHGAPVYLELCRERFLELQASETPEIGDFGGTTRILIERYVRYLDDAKSKTTAQQRSPRNSELQKQLGDGSRIHGKTRRSPQTQERSPTHSKETLRQRPPGHRRRSEQHCMEPLLFGSGGRGRSLCRKTSCFPLEPRTENPKPHPPARHRRTYLRQRRTFTGSERYRPPNPRRIRRKLLRLRRLYGRTIPNGSDRL